MKLKQFIFNPICVNTYVVYDENSGDGVIIDCGCSDPTEEKTLTNYIDSEKIHITHLLNTHLHFDHTYGNAFISQKYGVLPEANRADEFLLDWNVQQTSAFGLPKYVRQDIGNYLFEGDKIAFGEYLLEVVTLPGHSPGGLGFYCPQEKIIFVGDTLFLSSVGRTDLPGGDWSQLIESISKKVFVLPDDVKVYTGHGAPTSVIYEKENNLYFK